MIRVGFFITLMRQIILFITFLILSSSSYADGLIEHAARNSHEEETAITNLDASSSENQDWSDKAQEVLIQAFSLTGIQYKYGGDSPDTGFDCSGFVRYVFNQAAKITLPPTARAISQLGKSVKKDELQPGDLVFFNTLKSAFSHVGIYIGDNKFIHSPRAGGTVRVEDMSKSYWTKRFNGAQRLETELNNKNSTN
jgi:cell wall-associated NlpC family hydrolase